MQMRLALILSLFISVPGFASEIMITDPQDENLDPVADFSVSVRPGQKATVTAGIFEKLADGGWHEPDHKAPEFTWTVNCDSSTPSCPTISMIDGSVNVTIDVPICFPKGENIKFTVMHDPVDGSNMLKPATVTLKNSEEPSTCPAKDPDPGEAPSSGTQYDEDGDPSSVAGPSGPSRNGSSSSGSRQGSYGGGGGGGSNDSWGRGGNGNWRGRGDDSSSGASYTSQPGYNRGNAASAEVESCSFGKGQNLVCRTVETQKRYKAYLQAQARARAEYERGGHHQPQKQRKPLHSQAKRALRKAPPQRKLTGR